jgi:hypothetical protein
VDKDSAGGVSVGTVAEVLDGRARWGVEAADALAWLRGLPSKSVAVVFFSCPYEGQRTYGINFVRRGQVWVDWLRPIVAESARVSAGLVVVNAAGPVEDHSYSPTMEWLVADLTRHDGLVCGPSPWCWWKVCGTPGSGSTRYQRRDWEPLYGFCLPDRLPLTGTDNTAFGHPPKAARPGGAFSTRDADGVRANDPWEKSASRGGSGRGRRPNGGGKVIHTKRQATAAGDVMVGQVYTPPKISNPGNLIRARVGGGHLGHSLAHKNEAPMSLAVAERFVCWYCPPDGVVCDPFTGSGTTAHAAILHGRRFVGCDLRESQVSLTTRRLATVTPNLFGDALPGSAP